MPLHEPDRCPICGAELAEDSPGGFCPGCLLRQGLDGGPDDSTTRTGPSAPSAGVLETIAGSAGPLPRVLLRDTGPGEPPGPVVKPDQKAGADGSVRYRI